MVIRDLANMIFRGSSEDPPTQDGNDQAVLIVGRWWHGNVGLIQDSIAATVAPELVHEFRPRVDLRAGPFSAVASGPCTLSAGLTEVRA